MGSITTEKSAPWRDEKTLTNMKDLLAERSMPPSHLHKPEFAPEEEEILQHYKDWAYFCNYEFKHNAEKGKDFYDVPDVLYFDLMGVILRSHFDDHFDRIGPYFANAHIAYRDLEIVATSKDFGYSTMIQRYWGTSTDGHDFDFTFRITGLLRKKEGKWKWVHEHVSFPVDMVTQKGDFTCGLDASTSLYLERKE